MKFLKADHGSCGCHKKERDNFLNSREKAIKSENEIEKRENERVRERERERERSIKMHLEGDGGIVLTV